MLLKVHSTVAVVTGRTVIIEASFDKFGNAAEISFLLINFFNRTSFSLYCMNISLRNSFHSASVSSESISGCDTPSCPSKIYFLCCTVEISES